MLENLKDDIFSGECLVFVFDFVKLKIKNQIFEVNIVSINNFVKHAVINGLICKTEIRFC